VGEPANNDELVELQRMVRDNEAALKRAKNMISELKRHLSKEAPTPARPGSRSRKKKK
jgi:hypothetical protein